MFEIPVEIIPIMTHSILVCFLILIQTFDCFVISKNIGNLNYLLISLYLP